MKKVILFCLILALGVQACMDNEDNPNQEIEDLLEQQDVQITRHLQENNIDAEKNQMGVYVLPLVENPSGTAIAAGDVAEVTYRITQLDGTLIGENEGDSLRVAYDETGTFIPVYLYFSLGEMREGEKFRFYIPANYGFRNYTLENVVPYRSIIVMDVEVKEVYKTLAEIKEADIKKIESVLSAEEKEAETLGTSGVHKILLEEGEGAQPDAKDKVSVYYTGSLLNGEVFDTNTGASGQLYSFTVEGTESKPIPGFEKAVKSMKVGEKAVFYLPSGEAYGKRSSWYVAPEAVRQNYITANNGQFRSNVIVPPHSPLVFEIELVEVTKVD